MLISFLSGLFHTTASVVGNLTAKDKKFTILGENREHSWMSSILLRISSISAFIYEGTVSTLSCLKSHTIIPYKADENWNSLIFRIKLWWLNREDQIKALGLDNWVTDGNKEEACNRIIECVLKKKDTLKLSNLNLTSLPTLISKLSQLQRLGIDCNKLTSLPDSIGQLSELKWLGVHNNQLTSLPDSIDQLSQLQRLDIDCNKLTSLPDSIGQLSKLKSLNVHNNQLTSLPDSIGQLSELKWLGVHNNQLTSLPGSICQLSELEWLSVHNNQLTSLPGSICQLSELKWLGVHNNQLTSLPDSICQLSELESLNVHNNQLTSLPDSIDQLSKLEWLSVHNNQLTSLPNSILQLRSVLTIDLTHVGLSNEVLARLQAQTQQPGYNGPRFSISVRENRSTEEKPYEGLIQYVYKTIKKTVPNSLSKLIEDSAKKADLQSWINRLSWTADGQNNLERKLALYKTITGILEYAAENEEYRALFQIILMDASSTCGDRVTLSILLLDVAKQIAAFDKKDLKGLADLIIRGQFVLGILEEVAQNKISSLKFFDEIEVYLAYPIFLKETFNLPIHTDGMLYFTCSGLTKQDIKDAEEIVRTRLKDENEFINYLTTNDVWRNALKLNFPVEYKTIMDKVTNESIDPNLDFIVLTKKALGSRFFTF